MNVSLNRPSRPRRYSLVALPGFQDPEAALAVSAIDELRDRLYDVIIDLPDYAMDFVPEGATNSAAMLTIHMAWAEASWVSRASRCATPTQLAEALLPGKQGPNGDLSAFSCSATELVTLCKRVRQEVTLPGLCDLPDIDAPLVDDPRQMTVRGVLMHLIWHWTYHSGQVGLLRRLGGSRYKWTFASR
jgi:uncharacterized damage-inducible protein DinB